MNRITLRTPAKINPVLELLGKRPDGFHELALVFQAVSLFDELTLEKIPQGVLFSVSRSPEPLAEDDSNLVVKAARLFLHGVLKGQGGVKITLAKDIPLAAGLGGGSSDAAAALKGMDLLFETKLSEQRLMEMAGQLGSDVPFFLKGGTALGTGRGEKIESWKPAPTLDLILVKPVEGLSTAGVYRSGKAAFTSGDKARAFQNILAKGDIQEITASLYNGLEPASFFLMPRLREIKDKILGAGALGALVSGSGPTVFGLVESDRQGEMISRVFSSNEYRVVKTQTNPQGIEVVR